MITPIRTHADIFFVRGGRVAQKGLHIFLGNKKKKATHMEKRPREGEISDNPTPSPIDKNVPYNEKKAPPPIPTFKKGPEFIIHTEKSPPPPNMKITLKGVGNGGVSAYS